MEKSISAFNAKNVGISQEQQKQYHHRLLEEDQQPLKLIDFDDRKNGSATVARKIQHS